MNCFESLDQVLFFVLEHVSIKIPECLLTKVINCFHLRIQSDQRIVQYPFHSVEHARHGVHSECN